jgi:uncharacterized protein (TIGR03435 family)
VLCYFSAGRRPDLRAAVFRSRNYTLHSCIEWAYNLRRLQVEGLVWLSEVRIDINARAENRQADDDEFRLMLRTLLADRFGMNTHLVRKEQQVYVLTVGKDGS